LWGLCGTQITGDQIQAETTNIGDNAATGSQPPVVMENDETSCALLSGVGSTIGERANNVITDDKIALNYKLGFFTVLGTNEPRVVKLFPTTSCSCPAKSGCYHVRAAELAIGMFSQSTRRKLNLTSLRRNKRSRCDKTYGRKRPRVADVDVIPATDIDKAVLDDLELVVNSTQTVIQTSSPQPPLLPVQHHTESPPSSSQVLEVEPDVRTNNCSTCGFAENPQSLHRKQGRPSKTVKRVGCDKCPRWYHNVCVGLLNKHT
jgi:hypothetical protein